MNMASSDKGFTICVRAEIFPENSRAFYCLTFFAPKKDKHFRKFLKLHSLFTATRLLTQKSYSQVSTFSYFLSKVGKVPYNITEVTTYLCYLIHAKPY